MVRIMTDFAADIPAEFIKEHNLKVLPFYINIGEKSILADMNFKAEEFYEIMKTTEEIPQTSQCTPEFIEDMFRELGKDGEPVIYISISANASGIYNTANIVANRLIEEENLDITIIDSKTFSMGIGMPVTEAVIMAEKGASKEEITDFLTESYENNRVYFVVDDLSYLKRGGRIKATSAVIGELLDIKPVLYNNDGLVEVYTKVRGIKKAIAKLVEEAAENMESPEEGEVIVLEADAKDKAEIAVKFLEKKLNPKKISIHPVGPVITCHTGTGVMGLYFKHKKK